MDYKDCIINHYKLNWKSEGVEEIWDKGPMKFTFNRFCVLEFQPSNQRRMWTYATCCMSELNDKSPIELHLFSSEKSDECIELLTTMAYYHKTKAALNLWHTVNFGKPWQNNSKCTHGLISLPYLDGPNFEFLRIENNQVKFYWLIPITEKEVIYKIKHGINSLEERFEASGFNFWDSGRNSVI